MQVVCVRFIAQLRGEQLSWLMRRPESFIFVPSVMYMQKQTLIDIYVQVVCVGLGSTAKGRITIDEEARIVTFVSERPLHDASHYRVFVNRNPNTYTNLFLGEPLFCNVMLCDSEDFKYFRAPFPNEPLPCHVMLRSTKKSNHIQAGARTFSTMKIFCYIHTLLCTFTPAIYTHCCAHLLLCTLATMQTHYYADSVHLILRDQMRAHSDFETPESFMYTCSQELIGVKPCAPTFLFGSCARTYHQKSRDEVHTLK